MGDAVRVKYAVVVEIDPDRWMENYGLAPNKTVVEDVDGTMQELIAEAVNEYISRTGNSGYAVVKKGL